MTAVHAPWPGQRINERVMRTLADARKVLLGKQGRVPERFVMAVVEEEDCPRCEGAGDHRAYQGATYSVPCAKCHGTGTRPKRRQRRNLGVYERKIACDTYIYETPEGFIEMRLHETVIARWTPWWCELYTDGWPTTLTKDRLNEFTPAQLSSWRIWYHADGPLVEDELATFDLYPVPGMEPYGLRCWAHKTYKQRDSIVFFDGMKINAEGYCMNPPLLSKQRGWVRFSERGELELRKWARRLLKAARAGEARDCEECQDIIALYASGEDGFDLEHREKEHVIEHALKDELTLIPLLARYLAANGRGNVHDFARALQTDLWIALEHEVHANVTYHTRPGGGWQSAGFR